MEASGEGNSAEGGRQLQPNLSMEDRAFLDEFGRRISLAVGSSALLGGTGFYALSRQLGFRRRGLWTSLGATLCPSLAWYAVVSTERARVMDLGMGSPSETQVLNDLTAKTVNDMAKGLADCLQELDSLEANAGLPQLNEPIEKAETYSLPQPCAGETTFMGASPGTESSEVAGMTASVLRPFSAQRRFAGSASLCWREDRAVHAALPNSRGRGRRLGPGPCCIDSGGRPHLEGSKAAKAASEEGAEVPDPELGGDAGAEGGAGSQPTLPPPSQPSNLESNATSSASPASPAAWPAASPAHGDSVETPLETVPAVPVVPAVQVCIRMRPLLAWERAEGYKESAMEVRESPSGGMGICLQTEGRRNRHFQFNAVIGPERSQQEAWDMSKIDSVVSKVCRGFNATVFAYGQTGTGKTFTMEGFDYDTSQAAPSLNATSARPRVKARSTPSEQLGMVPRAVRALFEKLQTRRSEPPDGMNAASGADGCGDEPRGVSGVVVRVSFLQIYKEKIFDLLNPISSVSQREAARGGEDLGGLRMRWDGMKRHFFVENLFQYECGSAEEALQHYQDGIANKQVASTTMNVASSRSHTLLVFTVLRREGLESGQGREVVSQLSLVDLAGSERTLASTDTTSSGARFVEAVNVNQSLFVLRRVITALSKRDSQNVTDHTHVPYRESKLTSLLQNSLGGNSYLIMLACLAASERHDDENLSTLQYASQAACIRNAPQVNIDPKDRKIQELEAKLSAAHGYLLQALSLTELPSDLLEKERAAAVSAAGATGKFRPPRKDRQPQPPQPPQPPREKMEKTAPLPPRSRFGSKEKVASPTTSTATSWSKSEEGERGEAAVTLGATATALGSRVEPRKHPKAPKPPRNGPTSSLGDRLGLSARNPRSSTFSRLLQGEKSPRSSDWPFFARKPRTEGSELFAAVEDVLRSYDGASEGAEPRNPWAASLPPMASRRKESAANSARRPSSLPPVVPELEIEIGGDSAPLPPLPCKLWPRKPEAPLVISDASAASGPESLEPEATVTREQADDGGFDLPAPTEEAGNTGANDEAQELSTCRRDLVAAQQRLQELELEAKQMPTELTKLRAENTQLMSELQVFYKAMESKEPQDATKQRLEKFHSQLVLEAASLRNEVAGLKRKRWVIQAVLANGGESEDRVIKEELQKLRQKKSEEQPENPEPSPKG
ncbi:kif4 [Symbiodinium sp. CCMP2456]|nr:kif4 [Symbiodinium sp. CCMP2456]